MNERIDKAIAALLVLPGLLALIDDVDGDFRGQIWFQDWYGPMDDLGTLLDRTIHDELKTIAPQQMATVSHLLSEVGPGWDLAACYLTLTTLRDHPELTALFVERLLSSIRDLLEGRKPPERAQ